MTRVYGVYAMTYNQTEINTLFKRNDCVDIVVVQRV